MSHINVTINGRQYRMACEEGQEVRLLKLAENLESRIGSLRGKFGEIGDARLTVMAALTVCDELLDASHRIRSLEEELDALMGQDAGFRCLFALIGVKPLFVTMAELFESPRQVIQKIADAVQVQVNSSELDQAIAVSAAYGRDRTKAVSNLAEHFKRLAFGGAG